MSRKKKNTNRINVTKAITIMEVYGLRAVSFNEYQVRIWHVETDHMWDWYHTSGKLGAYRNGAYVPMGVFTDPEDVAIFIRDEERRRCHV